jgi:hypothetical protein
MEQIAIADGPRAIDRERVVIDSLMHGVYNLRMRSRRAMREEAPDVHPGLHMEDAL